MVVSVLTPAKVLIAARRLARARPHLAAVAAIVRHEDLAGPAQLRNVAAGNGRTYRLGATPIAQFVLAPRSTAESAGMATFSRPWAM